LIIIGTGGSAYDVLDIVEAINARQPTWAVMGFLDDLRPVGTPHANLPILGTLGDASGFKDAMFLNVVGSDRSYTDRPRIVTAIGLGPERFATLIHPAASVSSRARVGCGVYVNAAASVAGNVSIGDHVALGPNCTIGHDTVIERYTLVAPAAVISGFVHVGQNAYIGAAAAIRQRVRIGDRALVGIGAVVLKDVKPQTVVVGNPAAPLRGTSPAKHRAALGAHA
jgi:sugar O-acyltransferase (sialic acid O-acetyltransferase NeuD family)